MRSATLVGRSDGPGARPGDGGLQQRRRRYGRGDARRLLGNSPIRTAHPAGEITFDITNDAEQTHEFVVFKTDLAPDQLPTDEDGDVDEAGEGVEHVDEIEDIEGGSTQSLTVNLDAGSYVLICNLPGHYAQGMHAGFTAS